MSYGQLGILDSLAFAFGLFMEIPTGALGDLIGKRWTVRFALLCNGIAYVVMGAAQTSSALIAGFLLYQIGLALYSGAAEALQYDSLKERELEGSWDRVASAQNSVALLALIPCVLLGAPLYNLHPGLPHLAWGVVFLMAFVASLRMTEPKVDEQPTFSLRNYYNQLMTGARQLTHSNLRIFMPLMIGLPGMFFIYSWGVVQPAVAINFGFGPDEQAVIGSVAYLLVAIAVRFIPTIRRRFGDFSGLTLVNVAFALVLIGMALPLGAAGVTMVLMIRLTGSMAGVWMSIIINERTPSPIRATTLSTVALLTKLPYVLAAMLAGVMIESGQLGAFVIGMAFVSLALLGVAYWLNARMGGPEILRT